MFSRYSTVWKLVFVCRGLYFFLTYFLRIDRLKETIATNVLQNQKRKWEYNSALPVISYLKRKKRKFSIRLVKEADSFLQEDFYTSS